MNIKVDDKEIELNFGIGFLRELDKIAGIDVDGVSMGMGLTKTLPALQGYDPLALINVIYSATHAYAPRPSMKQVESYLETLSNKEIEKSFTDVLTELKKSPLVAFTMNRMAKNKN